MIVFTDKKTLKLKNIFPMIGYKNVTQKMNMIL